MNSFRRLFDHPDWRSFAVLIALHYAAIQLSFFCGKTLENEVIIWLPNSVLLIALLRFRLPLALLMAAVTFISNVVSNLPTAPLSESILLSSVNLVEIGLTWSVMRLTGTSRDLNRLRDFANFVIAGPLIGTFVSGILGAAVITSYGVGSSWLTLAQLWWFCDGTGLLIFAPILMLASSRTENESRLRPADVLMILIIAGIIGTMFYTLRRGDTPVPLSPTLIIPFALLLALRCTILWTSILVALIALLLSKLVAMGLNPFGDADVNHLTLHIQEFILTMSIICMGSSIFKNQLLQNERGLEQKVEERTAELAANLVQLKRLQAELIHSAKLASLGTLVAGVAHELNTPVGIGIMAASTLKLHVKELVGLVESKKLKRSELEQYIASLVEETDLIERNLQRAGNLVDSFKQIAVDQSREERRRFDLVQVVSENLLTVLPLMNLQQRELQIDIAESIRMDSYPVALGQVISSLASNALTHAFVGKSNGRVQIRARVRDHNVELDFIDDGVGMSGMVEGRVFDPFFTTRMGSNSGLGLYVVNNIVTGILGGSIELHTSPNHGAHFKLTLPQIIQS